MNKSNVIKIKIIPQYLSIFFKFKLKFSKIKYKEKANRGNLIKKKDLKKLGSFDKLTK